MITAHISFGGVVSFPATSGTTIVVYRQRGFIIRFVGDGAEDVETLKVATTNPDGVLRLVEMPGPNKRNEVNAEKIGSSEIQLQTADRENRFWLRFDVIENEASEITMGEPERIPLAPPPGSEG